MPTVHFHGLVIPASCNISLQDLPEICWDHPDVDLFLKIRLEVTDSRIHVTVDANKFSPEDATFIYIRAFDIARAAVELVAFKKGWGLTTVLTTMVDPSGIPSTMMFSTANFGNLCNSFDLERDFSGVFKMVISTRGLFSVLHDLICSITIPNESTVRCGRVVDGLKHLIASGTSSRSSEWLQMQNALRVDEAYLKMITEYSKDPRHGKSVRVEGRTTTEIGSRTWTIMNRFFEYKKRGSTPLPELEFPLLKG